MNKILATSLFLMFINSNSFATKLVSGSPANKNFDYSLSIMMPAESIKLNTNELNIPFGYYLSNKSLNDEKPNTEIRVTFNLLNSNCYAFNVIRPEFNKSIKSFTKTLKCEISKSGIYMGYATICLKGSAVGNDSTDLCKTALGNITVK